MRLAEINVGEIMGNHAVSPRVTPFLRIECKFWLKMTVGVAAANNLPSRFRRAALNMRSLKCRFSRNKGPKVVGNPLLSTIDFRVAR